METSNTQQETAMKMEPQKEHQWLQRFVGEWTFEGEATMEPGQPPSKFTGTESVRSLGGLWFLAEGQGEMPGCGAVTTLLTLGYDSQKQRYVGTWIGSMMTHLWVKDVTEFKSDDHRVLTSHMLSDDGNWQQFMTANYRRKK
jgi:hypothetical protein